MSEVTIRPFQDNDYAALVALRNAIRPNRAETIEGRRNFDGVLRMRGMEPARLIAEVGGQVVGYGDIVGSGDAQGADIGVDPAMRRQAIGSALWTRVEATLRERGAKMVRTLWIDVANHAVVAFLNYLGFQERERAWDLTLDLATFDRSRLPSTTNILAAPGITFTNLAVEGAHDESVLHRVHRLHNACRLDQPPAEDRLEPIPFDAWVAQLVQGPSALLEAFFLAKAGAEYVGMSHLQRSNDPGVVENGFTGVLPAYRNRGIARALKLRAIVYARDHEYQEIRTGNHAANTPMLRVNEILGFRKTAAKIRFEKKLSALASD